MHHSKEKLQLKFDSHISNFLKCLTYSTCLPPKIEGSKKKHGIIVKETSCLFIKQELSKR
jgi:hypothetical protein